MLPKLSLAESLGKQLSPSGMSLACLHREDAVTWKDGELLVPFILIELVGRAMDLAEAIYIADGNLVRSDSHNFAVLLVQLVDEEDTSTANNGFLERQSCESTP